MKVTVIGGHGKIALLTARILAGRGDEVTSVIRNPEHVPDVAATGALALVLDVEAATATELAEAFAGSDAIVWSAGAGGGNPDRTYAVDRDAAIRSMNAAELAGIKRYVMVSFLTADTEHLVPLDDPFYPYMAAKIAADEHLRAGALDYTILGPGALTLQEPSRLLDPAPDVSGDTGTSRGNVALAIAAALDDPSTIGRTINFTDGTVPVALAIAAAGG
ncbi:NAD(P)H-binding protein [Paeniglutamicibacter sp. NPDC091659]|uniref:NAD(P)H-binding protein n=1 Tax=Paeniglutamicibacter sp. NPDC091659 TaxID=3364389 RepID=UPI003818D761